MRVDLNLLLEAGWAVEVEEYVIQAHMPHRQDGVQVGDFADYAQKLLNLDDRERDILYSGVVQEIEELMFTKLTK